MSSMRRYIREDKEEKAKNGFTGTHRATLGGYIDGVYTIYTGVDNEVYVTPVGGGAPKAVKNSIAPISPNLEVIVSKAWGNEYEQIVDFNFNSLNLLSQVAGPAFHGPTHNMSVILGQSPAANQLGPDPAFVSDRQLSTLACFPVGTMQVQVQKGEYFIDFLRYWFDGDVSIDFTSDVPGAGLAKWALLEADTAATLKVRYSGTFASNASMGSMLSNIPKRIARRKEIAAILLVNGMTVIGWQHIHPTQRTPGMSDGYSAVLQTTNATVTEIAAISLAEGEAITVFGLVTGSKSDLSAAIGGNFTATFRRAAAGNVTIVGSATYNSQEDSSGTPAFTVVADTTAQTVSIRVAGIAAETWNWITNFSYAIR